MDWLAAGVKCLGVAQALPKGLPVVVMALKLAAVISTGFAGVPELVRHGVDGWPIAPRDVEALVDALTELLDTPTTERYDVKTEAGKLAELFVRKQSC